MGLKLSKSRDLLSKKALSAAINKSIDLAPRREL